MAGLLHRLRTFFGLAMLRACETSAVVSRFPDGRTVVTGFGNEAEAVRGMHADWHRGASDTWVWSRD